MEDVGKHGALGLPKMKVLELEFLNQPVGFAIFGARWLLMPEELRLPLEGGELAGAQLRQSFEGRLGLVQRVGGVLKAAAHVVEAEMMEELYIREKASPEVELFTIGSSRVRQDFPVSFANLQPERARPLGGRP